MYDLYIWCIGWAVVVDGWLNENMYQVFYFVHCNSQRQSAHNLVRLELQICRAINLNGFPDTNNIWKSFKHL